MIYQAHHHPLVFGSDIQFGMGQNAAASWWLSGGIAAANCVAAYQPKGAANIAASYVNLANPGTFDCVVVQVPGWDAINGWIRNGVGTGALNTGVNPAASSWSMLVRFANHTATANRYQGKTEAGKVFAITGVEIAGLRHACYNSGVLSVAPALVAAVFGFAGQTAYVNGVADAGAIPGAWAGAGANTIYMLACNGIAEVNWPATLNVQAAAIYNVTITAPQVAAVAAAMALL